MKRNLIALLLVLTCLSGALPVAGAEVAAVPAASDLAPAPLPTALSPQGLTVARDPAGHLWAAWEADSAGGADIYVARQTNGVWSPAQPAIAQPNAWDRFPSLAITADGQPWLAWASASHSQPNRRTLFVSNWTDGQWSEPRRVPLGSAVSGAYPALVAAPGGTLWLAWSGFDGAETDIYASRWDGRDWSEPWRISGERGRDDFQPHLILAADGTPWLVWVGHDYGPDDEIFASRWTGVGWTAEQMVNRDDDTLDSRPSIALGPDGQPWVAWMGYVATGERTPRRILFARWDASRSAWTPEQLASSSPALSVDEEGPSLAIDGQGQMHLAWVAIGNGVTALAGARWTGTGWTEAQVIRSGVDADLLAAQLDGGQVAFLWLAPEASPAPVGQVAEETTGQPLATWVAGQVAPEAVLVNPVPNRYLAFGDSITWGEYNNMVWDSYPVRLERKLDTRVRPSEVVNSGLPSERVTTGKFRISEAVSTSTPKYILIMEGTNDVSTHRDPGEVYQDIDEMIYNARHAGVDDVKLMLATLIPRVDDYNNETKAMNQQAIIPIADAKSIPICQQYQAFEDYGNYAELIWDDVHPNDGGLQLMADTWYDCVLRVFTEIFEDITAPEVPALSVPSQSECSGGVAASWSANDNLNGTGVASYDVQVRVDSGSWTDWLVAYPGTTGSYPNVIYGHRYYFRARARDRMGNVSAWSGEQSTEVTDTTPPYEVHVNSLDTVSLHPFTVGWGGSDACSGIASYNVRYNIDGSAWVPWKTATTATSAGSEAAWPCTHRVYLQAQACDNAGHCSGWSASVSTVLACYGLSGEVRTVREQPVALSDVSLNPAALLIKSVPGGFLAYLNTSGAYDISVSRTGFGSLPAMLDVPVNASVSGLEFYLPPLDNAVTNGGFESGSLVPWQVAGTVTLDAVAHTGNAAARLAAGGTSTLSQSVTPSPAITSPTLSFLVRLYAAGPAATLDVGLWPSGGALSSVAAPVTYTLPVASDSWTHEWLNLDGLVGGPLTVKFRPSGSSAILLDEVSLGTSVIGGYWHYLPVVKRAY